MDGGPLEQRVALLNHVIVILPCSCMHDCWCFFLATALFITLLILITNTNVWWPASIICQTLLSTVKWLIINVELGNFIKDIYYRDSDLYLNINPLTAKLFNQNFHSLEVVSRWRDPQLQVSENYSDLTKWRSTVFKYCWLISHFIFTMFKRWHLMCQ